jgi:uncharacterized membrane protein
MSKRTEAFGDGVFAVIIVRALELKAPHGADWDAVLAARRS